MALPLENDPINELEENLECTVCLEPLKDPRTLPCFHSFCKDCLEDVVKTCRDKAPRDRPVQEFPCPNCREMFTLDPDKNVADMRRNHFICNMVKATAVLNRDRKFGVPCSHNCTQSYSVARCVTCEKFLCQECLTAHNSYRGHTGHSVLTMEELSKPENRKKIKDKMYCNEHPGEILKVYCETCDQLICKDCMDFKHIRQNHSCFLVKDVANKYKELLASKNETMDKVLAANKDCLEELSEATKRLDRGAEEAKTEIIQRKELILNNIVEVLDTTTRTLLNKVRAIRAENRPVLENQTLLRKQYGESLQNYVRLCKKLVEQGTEEEIISSQKMMLDSANNLLDLEKRKKLVERTFVPKVNFNYSYSKILLDDSTTEEVINSLGNVDYHCFAPCEIDRRECNYETIETQQKIDGRQLAQIMEIQDLHDVRIECEPIGYFRISGEPKNLSTAVGKIHNIIYCWERERHRLDVNVRKVEWFYYDDNEGVVIPEKYAKEMSAKIETEYKRNPSGTVEVGDDEYEIDFKTMTETSWLTSVKVYRRPREAFPFPENWENQPIDGSTGQELFVYRFNIEKHDTEYDQIHDMFQASLLSEENLPRIEVVKIERIQNPELYQLYLAKKQKMSNGGNELLLYHGTTKDAVEKINCTGFNRSYCGKNAAYGNGVYFAKESSYSSRKQFALPDEKGLQYMYMAKVLVGKYTHGEEGLIVPPPIDSNANVSNPNLSYDSVVDSILTPQIYVLFYDYQHYPEYLITFKTESTEELRGNLGK